MKKLFFALSLLVVAPSAKASEAAVENSNTADANVAVVVSADTTVSEADVKADASSSDVSGKVVDTTVSVADANGSVTSVSSKNVFDKGFDFVSNGFSTTKNGVVNTVTFVQNGVVTTVDTVTGTVERFTPAALLNVTNSVRELIANYPLTAMALTAFGAVKASEYFSCTKNVDEDGNF